MNLLVLLHALSVTTSLGDEQLNIIAEVKLGKHLRLQSQVTGVSIATDATDRVQHYQLNFRITQGF